MTIDPLTASGIAAAALALGAAGAYALARNRKPIAYPPTTDELRAADEVFITSTTRDIMPVALIGDHRIKQSPGPVTLRLMETFKTVLEDPANLC